MIIPFYLITNFLDLNLTAQWNYNVVCKEIKKTKIYHGITLQKNIRKRAHGNSRLRFSSLNKDKIYLEIIGFHTIYYI